MPTGDPARRIVLLIGAGGRLGSAFCRRYAAEYDIVAVCRTRLPTVPSQLEQFVDPLDPTADLAENVAAVYVVRADLELPGQIERVVDIALSRFDGVDLLVNAAVYSHWHAPGLLEPEIALVDLDRHFAVNVGIPARLAARVASEFWKHRVEDNRARNRNIVNVSSTAATKVYPGGQSVYGASKAALNQLTRHLGSEFATIGVRANAVAPNSFPQIVSTEQVVASIARLDAETVTGKVLVVDSD